MPRKLYYVPQFLSCSVHEGQRHELESTFQIPRIMHVCMQTSGQVTFRLQNYTPTDVRALTQTKTSFATQQAEHKIWQRYFFETHNKTEHTRDLIQESSNTYKHRPNDIFTPRPTKNKITSYITITWQSSKFPAVPIGSVAGLARGPFWTFVTG
jgi:hypothetical protein